MKRTRGDKEDKGKEVRDGKIEWIERKGDYGRKLDI